MDDLDLLTSLPGLRDFYPKDWQEIEYILNKMREVSRSYSYEEYEGPSLEQVKLIEAKSGAELMKEIFQLHDRSDRHLLLRPEQTPTLARMLAREQQRFKRPIRWFSIPRLFRDETVQKGRVREFWQLNVDILGEDSVVADAETISVGVDIVRACGIADDEYNVFVNHRGLLNNYINSLTDIDSEKIIPVIDKKMTYLQNGAEKRFEELGSTKEEAKEEALLLRRIANSSGGFRQNLMQEASNNIKVVLDEVASIIKDQLINQFEQLGVDKEASSKLYKLTTINGNASQFMTELQELDLPDTCQEAMDELNQLATYLEAYGTIDPIVFDASMARGLDYYTGIVYEAFDSTGEVVRAIFGGGRYADLVEVMGGTPLSGVGFGMGETVIMELMKLRDAFPDELRRSVDIYMAPIKEDPIPLLIELGQRLKPNFDVTCNPFSWKLGRHFELADEMNATLVLLLGNRDIENGVVSVRIMETSDQLELNMDDTLEDELLQILEEH